MYSIGIDSGSTTTKGILYNGQIVKKVIMKTSARPRESILTIYNELSEGLDEKPYFVVTGYGRELVDFADKKITEITCHGKGAKYLCGNVRTVIDIGGQDSKVIKLDRDGNLIDFLMNDKCAAGTGRFLEVMINILDTEINSIDSLTEGVDPYQISSMCTVFAESEIVSLLAQDIPKENIAAGILKSIANKGVSILNKGKLDGELAFTGGLAQSKELVKMLKNNLNRDIFIAEDAQVVGALGAAIIGYK